MIEVGYQKKLTMDVRGVEVTNQLRSAIRAKLLELGVRYDEELPDYILVMVVNKKSRLQMHEDLHLFLENNTTPFVDWLHDQVLKKLQKVTIPKKKPTREFVPTVVVKQEEEKKKKKISALAEETKVKEEPPAQKTPPKPIQIQEKPVEERLSSAVDNISPEIVPSRLREETKALGIVEDQLQPLDQVETRIETVSLGSKRILTRENTPERSEKRLKPIEPPEEANDELEEEVTPEKRLRSCINKPKITSVVSVTTRLGVISPRKKFEVTRNSQNNTDNHRKNEKRSEKLLYEPVNRRGNLRGRNFDEVTPKRNREEPSNRQVISVNRIRIPESKELNEKVGFTRKSRVENSLGSVKDRLGINSRARSREPSDNNSRNVRNRLGAVKSKFRALGRLGPCPVIQSRGIDRGNESNEDDVEMEEDEEDTNIPIKSHIIAVNNVSAMEKIEKTTSKIPKSLQAQEFALDEKDEINDDVKALASKVIVTPRPLKPLQPVQKRATQSLLLRAVAEANQSVVKQKNPEPILPEKKPVLKRLRPTGTREVGQNLSVHLNATKRLVMEKIQVEITNQDTVDKAEPEPYVPRAVSDDHMGVVMSLFKRSDDNQKFLVTLNGYNNNGMKDPNSLDDDERLEMAVNEDDELALQNAPNDQFANNDSSPNDSHVIGSEDIDTDEKIDGYENNENYCDENLSNNGDLTRKRRKLSPIVYTRSRSPSPNKTRNSHVSQITKGFEKRPVVSTIIINEKSQDKCRYWPNCTQGAKCAFAHPAVPCSAFPGCKFGAKCAYKHPKCKFGLSCTKLGCVFSHPSQQCKYHPYCTKPGCVYLHPPPVHQVAVPSDTPRDKFTWRRRD